MATNQYPANCSLCGARVPAGAGRLAKADGRWIVSHPAGACGGAARPAVAPAPAKTRAPRAQPMRDVVAGEMIVESFVAPYVKGEVLRCGKVAGGGGPDGHWFVVVEQAIRRGVEEDDESEGRRIYVAIVRPATEAECAAPAAIEAAAQAADAIKAAKIAAIAAQQEALLVGAIAGNLPANARKVWTYGNVEYFALPENGAVWARQWGCGDYHSLQLAPTVTMAALAPLAIAARGEAPAACGQ